MVTTTTNTRDDETEKAHGANDGMSSSGDNSTVHNSANNSGSSTTSRTKKEASSSSSSSSSRIQMQLGASRKRKRTKTTTAASSTARVDSNNNNPSSLSLSSSSSSSSSDEEDEHRIMKVNSSSSTGGRNTSGGNYGRPSTGNNMRMQTTTATPPPPTTSKTGWRVKLYRLNTDGSWDDRGTGRITCQYNSQQHYSQSLQLQHNSIFARLGEPTLILRSEHYHHRHGSGGGGGGRSSNSSNHSSSSSSPPCLLQSKVLLREPYHRQGANILTWCEPHHYPEYDSNDNEAKDVGSTSAAGDGNNNKHGPSQERTGVDLALSFQDNAGCLDIFRQITHVQSRAAEWLQRTGTTASTSAGTGAHHPHRAGGGKGGSSNSSSSSSTTMATEARTTSAAAAQQQPQQQQSSSQTGGQEHTSASTTTGSVTDMAHAVAAAHHATLHRQEQHAMWVNVASEAAAQHHLEHVLNYNHGGPSSTGEQQDHHGVGRRAGGEHATTSDIDANISNREESSAEAVAVSMAAAAAAAYGNDTPSSSPEHHHQQQQQQQQPSSSSSSLPNPPTLQNLGEIADIIAAAQQLQQRESLAVYMSRNDCFYLRALLGLFPSAEAKGDYGALATLAACIKTILLMNDPSTIELIVSETDIYEHVCSVLEYDPDLRDKANHRWFLRERAKFRTVVLMEDQDLVCTIHKSFRVAYLRDTLLRPTMDESSLSTLSSLQTFTHAEVVKGVTLGGDDSYLVKVLRLLGREVPEIAKMEWLSLEDKLSNASAGRAERNVEMLLQTSTSPSPLSESNNKDSNASPSLSSKGEPKNEAEASTSWKQHLAPQDGSLASRLIRRKGALSFFRELFNMVRVSLQQGDKDDFYAAIVNMEVSLEKGKEESGSVNLLSLLASVLADPSADVADKGGVLEIIAAIAMHDPSHIRQQCLELHEIWKKEEGEGQACPASPKANDRKQIIFCCSPNDLLASLLFLMAVETDAGLLLQTSEILRVILDTEMLGEHGPLEGGPPGMQHPPMDHHTTSHDGPMTSDQNSFLTMFYEHYVQWLAAPFQYAVLHPVKRTPDDILTSTGDSPLMQRMMETLTSGVSPKDPLLRQVPLCAIRSSFAVELLSFCVRAHLHRMKFFLLRSRVLGSVLRILKPSKPSAASSGDRCLKLAALRFLRSILSVKDEFYHRHIIQHNLFTPVFEAFRANPVGDNLVSSAIVEMCDFIHNQNIKSLIEYIVTKHLSVSSPNSVTDRPSLEDVATPYVQTLTILRRTYEEDLRYANEQQASEHDGKEHGSGSGSYFDQGARCMSEKAQEDQRKFREVDEEESYFDCDDGEEEQGTRGANETPNSNSIETEGDLHRTPRMFSLAEQASWLESHGIGNASDKGESEESKL